MDVLSLSSCLILCLTFTVYQTAKEGLCTSVALIVGTAVHRILLGLAKEAIIRIAETLVLKYSLNLGLLQRLSLNLTFELS